MTIKLNIFLMNENESMSFKLFSYVHLHIIINNIYIINYYMNINCM